MPRARHAQGRPGTAVIPADWSATHRPVAAKTMTGECAIRRPGGTQGEFDPSLGYAPTVPHPPFHTGSCRVQVSPIFHDKVDSGGQQITTHGYLVTVEWNAATGVDDIKVDDILKITAVDDNGDPTLAGHELLVTGVARGTLTWERDLTCIENLG